MKVVLTHRIGVAVQALVYLASRPDACVKAAVIGSAIGIQTATVSRALRECQQANLVTSRPGRAGGYRLVGSPDALTLRHVVQALEGPIQRADGLPDHPDGSPDAPALDRVWSAARSAMSESLAATTLAAAAAGGRSLACVSLPADGDPPPSAGSTGFSPGA